MPIFFLVKSSRNELVRCAYCFTVKPRAYKGSNDCVYCAECGQKALVPKIEEHEYELYKLCQNCQKYDYINFASETLGVPHTTVEGRIQRLRNKGIPIGGTQRRFPCTAINAAGQLIPLTKLRHQILTLATSQENLIKYEIIKEIADKVGISRDSVRNHLLKLRQQGFAIPKSTKRRKNLKLKILQKINFDEDRSVQVKKLARQYNRSGESINSIIQEIEKEKKQRIKETRTSDEIVEVLQRSHSPMSAKAIAEAIGKSRHTVYLTCRRLAEKDKLERIGNKLFALK